MRSSFAALCCCSMFGLIIATAGPVRAQPPKVPKLVGMTQVKTIQPTTGFIDDPFAFDGAGGRLLYVNADAGYLAELAVIDLSQGAVQLSKVDISKFTTTPTAVRFVDQGFFVVSRASPTDKATAALLDGSGKVLRKFGPATDIALSSRDGQRVVVLYNRSEKKAGKRSRAGAQITHTIEVVSLDKGRRIGKKAALVADDKGRVAKLDFRINHFEREYTRVVGIKGGTWDAKQNQRSPDHEAWYDAVTGVFEKRIEIADVMTHAYLMRARAGHQNQQEFLAVAEDLSSLDIVDHEKRQPIELAQPFGHYDPKSLVYQPTDDGLFVFSLTIDPVNKEAVARKRADPEYLDLYVYRSGDTKARRLARYLMDDKKKRTISWRATEEYWILVPRLIGFSRGGKELQIYRIERP